MWPSKHLISNKLLLLLKRSNQTKDLLHGRRHGLWKSQTPHTTSMSSLSQYIDMNYFESQSYTKGIRRGYPKKIIYLLSSGTRKVVETHYRNLSIIQQFRWTIEEMLPTDRVQPYAFHYFVNCYFGNHKIPTIMGPGIDNVNFIPSAQNPYSPTPPPFSPIVSYTCKRQIFVRSLYVHKTHAINL